MRKKVISGFSLLEVLFVLLIFSGFVAILWGIYQGFLISREGLYVRQELVRQSSKLLDDLHFWMQDYKVDYEEYWNRKWVGCNDGIYGDDFEWNVGLSGYCSNFTHYGNTNSVYENPNVIFKKPNPDHHTGWLLYFCSSSSSGSDPLVIQSDVLTGGGGCFDEQFFHIPYYQSWMQYRQHFFDLGGTPPSANSASTIINNTFIGMGPDAIVSSGLQEIYLIDFDEGNRLFFRRKNMGDRYTLQMLRLVGLDAGDRHDFDINNSSGVWDGVIDTWVCDLDNGFFCNGKMVDDKIYSGYRLALDENDGWIDILDEKWDLRGWDVQIYPVKDPEYAVNQTGFQMSPYIKINMELGFNTGAWNTVLWSDDLKDFSISLQTVFSVRNWYR